MILFYEDLYSSFLIFCHCCDCKNLILLFASLYFFISHFHQIIHYCIFNSPGFIKNQFNDQLPFGLLAQLVKVRPVSQRSEFKFWQAWIFQAFFSQLHKLHLQLQGSSSVPTCESYNILIIIISRILLMACRVLTFTLIAVSLGAVQTPNFSWAEPNKLN